MTRTRFPCWLCMLLALLVLPACTTTQRNVAATTVCLASFAADIAISVHSHTWAPGGLLGLLVCDMSGAVASQWVAGDAAQPQPVAREESSR